MNIMINYRDFFQLEADPKKDDYLLTLTLKKNMRGIIYKITAILFAHGWDIIEANFETDEDGNVKDLFHVRSFKNEVLDEPSLEEIRKDVEDLFFRDLLVIDYLDRFPDLTLVSPTKISPVIRLFNPDSVDSTVLDIRTIDRPGLLFEISQLLYLLDIDILSVTAKTEEKMVRDTFLLRREMTERLDENMMKKLNEGLEKIL
ncbi:MAG: hypothetical protein H7A24_02345 [Leptospiraceae bacterium]|nr:hypothetical protein [Leptospiraceae bacterium]MCP5510690.1 hypothetical protein [Leptospiraceae bacterium]